MARTLQDDMREAFYANVLDTGAFGELVTWYPAGGGTARTLTAKISHRRETSDADGTRLDVDEIVATVGRDETHAKGGVLSPRIGDTLVREGESGQEDRYAWGGQLEASPPHSWRLVMTRPRRRRIGTEQRR